MAARIVETAYLANIDDLRAKMAQAAALNEKAGASIGDAFTKGTTKAGGAITKLSNEMGKMGIPLAGSLAKVGSALDQATSKTSKLGAAMSALGKVGAVGGLAAFAAAAYEGVKGASALQQQMEMLHTQAGKSQTEVKNMTQAVLGMASSVGTSPQKLAEALFHIESAGFSGTQALNMLRTSAEGAKVGNSDLVQTTQALAAVMYSGISGAQNLSQAMGTLNATVGSGDMTMQDLVEAFGGPLIGVAKGAGVSLKDVGAALADFGDLNVRGADAATMLRQAIQFMLKPAATAGPELQKLGLNSQSFAKALNQGGLNDALTLLHDRLDAVGQTGSNVSTAMLDLFSKKGSAGITMLLNSFDRLQQKYKDVGAGAGSFNADWQATTKNLAFQWSQLEAGAAAFADKLGGYLIPKLQALGAFIAGHKGAIEDFAKIFGVVMVAAIAKFTTESIANFGKWLLSWNTSSTQASAKAAQTALALQTSSESQITSLQAESNAWKEMAIEAAAAAQQVAIATGKIDADMLAMSDQASTEAAAIDAQIASIGAAADAGATKIGGLRAALSGIAGKGFVAYLTLDIIEQLTKNLPGAHKAATPEGQHLQSQLEGIPILGKLFQVGDEAINSLNRGIHNLTGGRFLPDAPPNVTETQTKNGFGPHTPFVYVSPNGTKHTVARSGNGNGPYVAPPGGGTTSTALTAAQVHMETAAQQFLGLVKSTSAGGTSRTQQAATLTRLESLLRNNPNVEGNVVAPLNATGNPKLTSLASNIETAWAAMTAKITTIIDTDTTKGQSEIQKLQNAANGSNFTALKDSLTGQAKTSYGQLVTELKGAITATHSKALQALLNNLENNWKSATDALKSMKTDMRNWAKADTLNVATAVKSAATQAASNAASAAANILGLQTTASSNAAGAATGISGLRSTASSNQMSAATQAITDASKISSDRLTASAQAISDAARLAQDAANAQLQAAQDAMQAANSAAAAQVSAINDATQTQVDTLGERGLYGLALQAQIAKVALDQQKAIDDAQIAAAQAHVDQTIAQTNAATAIAQRNADRVQQQTDANTASAQAQLDYTTQQANAQAAIAQAQADTTAITSAIANQQAQAAADAAATQAAQAEAQASAAADIVSGQAAQANAQAQAAVDAAQFGTAAQQKAAQAAQQYINAQSANAIAAAEATSGAVTNTGNAQIAAANAIASQIANQTAEANQNAANALQQAQASAAQQIAQAQAAYDLATAQGTQQNAQAQAALNAAQSNAALLVQQAQSQLSAIQNSTSVTEAHLQSIYNITAQLAATQFAGGGTVINLYGVPFDNAAELTNQIDWAQRTKTPAPVGS